MKTLTLLFAACLAGLADDAADVRAALDRFNAAAKNGESAALDKLLAADLTYVHSTGRAENKAECIKALAETKPNYVMNAPAAVKIYGKTAVLTGRLTANVVQNGQPAKIPLDMIQVWVKEGKDWRMAARHTLRLQP